MLLLVPTLASALRCGMTPMLSRAAPPRAHPARCCVAPVELTGGQRRELRAHAGRLAASKVLRYVSVSEAGRSAKEVGLQLDAAELVRCKFAVNKKKEAAAMADELAALTGAAVAEVLGHTALLYRPSKKQIIKLSK